jgi:hypothetical protein
MFDSSSESLSAIYAGHGDANMSNIKLCVKFRICIVLRVTNNEDVLSYAKTNVSLRCEGVDKMVYNTYCQ